MKGSRVEKSQPLPLPSIPLPFNPQGLPLPLSITSGNITELQRKSQGEFEQLIKALLIRDVKLSELHGVS